MGIQSAVHLHACVHACMPAGRGPRPQGSHRVHPAPPDHAAPSSPDKRCRPCLVMSLTSPQALKSTPAPPHAVPLPHPPPQPHPPPSPVKHPPAAPHTASRHRPGHTPRHATARRRRRPQVRPARPCSPLAHRRTSCPAAHDTAGFGRFALCWYLLRQGRERWPRAPPTRAQRLGSCGPVMHMHHARPGAVGQTPTMLGQNA